MMTMLFVLSIFGLTAILSISFHGKYGNLLKREGVIGSMTRGMVGVFSFFIIVVLLIWLLGIILFFIIVTALISLFGYQFKNKNFYWSKRKPSSPYETMNPFDYNDVKTITLEPEEWKEPQTPKKIRRPRKKKK